jgi:hypothetical protein
MFNLFPITMAKMTMTMNDVAVQSMFLLIDNILPHKTSLKLGGRILNKGPKKKLFQHMAHLVKFLYLH